MNDKAFFDTNILVYLYSTDEPLKQEISLQIVKSYEIFLSTQVINEFANVMLKKYKPKINDLMRAIEEVSANFIVTQIAPNTSIRALTILEKYRFSYFDSLMISSALETQCSIFYTEDLHHQQVIENQLHIINPFKQKSIN